MPLQNRVTPFGEIVAIPERGTMMGNRGGRLHDEGRRLGTRRWTSRRWICCELAFKGWWRPVMGRGYTELFFLDEVTALAAGHRPCFECRRKEAKAFAAAFSAGQGNPGAMRADAMDEVLHQDRLEGRRQRRCGLSEAGLPMGTMIAVDGAALALHETGWLRWLAAGWEPGPLKVPDHVSVLTPSAIVAALRQGYMPRWHGSARRAGP
jgi:hypothetical protein